MFTKKGFETIEPVFQDLDTQNTFFWFYSIIFNTTMFLVVSKVILGDNLVRFDPTLLFLWGNERWCRMGEGVQRRMPSQEGAGAYIRL